jgi:LAO/AO transport system kinase
MPDENKPDEQQHKPEWVPSDGGSKFATNVMKGVVGGHDGMSTHDTREDKPRKPAARRRGLTVEDHVQGVLEGNRTILGRTITLVESNAPAHFDMAQEVLRQLLPHTGNSTRVGITGVPGAGKSTFIEALGTMLIEQEHRVAVLAVDPSSSVTRGSILGDKTRMENLARQPNAFIRPSPTSGTLGGVSRKSRETMLVCEASGFDVILVETVGVGQSEVTVRSMVDFFLLLLITGGGDELQGIKKGVIELADALLINKADGDNKVRAQSARSEYNRALHYLTPATEGWTTRAYTCSAVTREGVPRIWEVIENFCQQTTESGVFQKRRRSQMLDWLHSMIEDQLKAYFFTHPAVRSKLPEIEQSVMDGTRPATAAASELLRTVAGE